MAIPIEILARCDNPESCAMRDGQTMTLVYIVRTLHYYGLVVACPVCARTKTIALSTSRLIAGEAEKTSVFGEYQKDVDARPE